MTLSYFIGWWLFRAIFTIYFRWRVYHPERVPLTGSVILASNHTSFLDPPLVGTGVMRPVNSLARKTLFRFPVMAWVLRSWNCVPLDRDGGSAAGLKEVLDRLKRGGAIIMFPEGTRSLDGTLQPARSGIGLAIIKSTATVVPVRVFGTFEAYGRAVKFPRPYQVIVKYGEPLSFAAQRTEAKTCSKNRLKLLYQEVAAELMAAIAKLQPCRDKTHFP